ncbi:MAG: PH domain-containing protein [Phycisphaerales bacterium]
MTSANAAANATVTTARFNPLYRPYLVITIGLTMCCTVVGIPAAIVWFCGVGPWWARHYFDKLTCTLDSRTLRFRKGILFQVEKTIPLENIQDVTFIEGPILKKFHLATLKFETAGHSAGQAHDMHLTGIIDAHEFRNRIVEAREALRHQLSHRADASPPAGEGGFDQAHLAVLERISSRLDEVAGLLRDRR